MGLSYREAARQIGCTDKAIPQAIARYRARDGESVVDWRGLKVHLSRRERYIFDRRLRAVRPLTLEEIGEHLGISRQRVAILEKDLLRKLEQK